MYGSGNKALDDIADELDGNSQSTFGHLNSQFFKGIASEAENLLTILKTFSAHQQEESISSNQFWISDPPMMITSDDQMDFNKNNMENNVSHLVDSDDHTDKWMCVNKDCLYHTKTEDIFVSINNVDDKDVVYDDNVEWVCINKDCLYHNHIVDTDDEDEKSISNNFGDSAIVKK
ncbi:P-loop containing nucleoside triphosphate hydrolases superfamily protein [Artemisia annua]|uniref:P-loop containing nucleoside triphosphate hydrolases superfamily protein n=1 Tax=Artemisia annua TaxID=35608 RepID=A0A2U1N246_ARTAN|nr:P-loop containing nucleoside triphosphate hydrolases superfamily protein [Artemisia annua]